MLTHPSGSLCGKDSPVMKKLLPTFIIATGLVFIFIGGGTLYFNRATSNPRAAQLPESIAGLGMAQNSAGQRALDEIRHLHQQEFPLVGGAVGSYGLGQEAKLWVAESSFKFMAAGMTRAMREKIASVNSPFTPTGEFKDGNRTIYELDGMGQKHYYFQSGKMVIWLAADEGIAEQAIQDALEFYP